MDSRTLLVAAVFALAFVPRAAFAQTHVSDADREAARDLYNTGVPLQQQGKFAEALDSFERSYQVYPAPTTALHVAQCQASLNHLVEAEEDFRALSNATLPDGSPQAFVLAQEEAKKGLADVEPRVPRVRVTITPDKIPGLTVTVDGQPMSSALVGVPRAIDPGAHQIVATAPGYERAEQGVTVQEREVRDVRLALRALPQPPVGTGPAVGVGPGYRPIWAPQGPGPVWTPPPYVKPKPEGPATSLMLGLTFGAGVPVGGQESDTVIGSTTNSGKLTDNMSATGFVFGGDVGIRFREGYFGLQLQGGFYGAGAAATPNSGNSANTIYFGGVLGVITNPTGVGFYGDFGAGYRWLNESINSGTLAAYNRNVSGLGYGGPEFELGIGIHIKAGPIRIIPKATMGLGAFINRGATVSGVSASDNNFSNTTAHAFFLFGLSGFYDIPIGS